MKKVCLVIFLMIILVLNSNIIVSAENNELNMIERLELVKSSNLNASKKAQENKITEMRNIIWQDINPELKRLSEEIENHIELIKYIDLYNFIEINITHGDIKRGDKLFERAKSDIIYIINKPTDKNYIAIIDEINEIIIDLKEIVKLIPEIEIEFRKEDEVLLLEKETINDFSIRIKDTKLYNIFKKQDIDHILNNFDLFTDEIAYIIKNSDEHNKTQVVTSINQKITSKQNIDYVEIYEIYEENTNINNIIYKTPHSKNLEQNSALLHKGKLLKGNTIISEINILTNYTKLTKHLLFILEDNATNEITIQNTENKSFKNTTRNEDYIQNKDSNTDNKVIKVDPKKNYTLEITAIILLIILFSILIHILTKMNKTAIKLEESRKQINKLKKEI